MRKNENIILYGLLILVVGVLVLAFSGFSLSFNGSNVKNVEESKISNVEGPKINTVGEPSAGKYKSIDSGSTNDGDVSIELTPIGFENGKLSVSLSVNTHSVSLEKFDLKEITELQYEGKTVKPISAPKLAGHHNSGTLVFDAGSEPKSFKIIIKGIPKVQERVFEWA